MQSRALWIGLSAQKDIQGVEAMVAKRRTWRRVRKEIDVSRAEKTEEKIKEQLPSVQGEASGRRNQIYHVVASISPFSIETLPKS